MEKIASLLERHLSHFKNIEPDCSISDALCRMSTHNSDYLIVMDEKKQFLGLLTERDIARKALFMHRSLEQTKVKELMNTQWPFADTHDSVANCMKIMREYHVKFVPVFQNMEFVGVVSADDILNEVVMNRSLVFD